VSIGVLGPGRFRCEVRLIGVRSIEALASFWVSRVTKIVNCSILRGVARALIRADAVIVPLRIASCS